MGNQYYTSNSVHGADIGGHVVDNADYMAEILNSLGFSTDRRLDDEWLQEFAAGLDADGKTALRQLVARLDEIDATSTEGR